MNPLDLTVRLCRSIPAPKFEDYELSGSVDALDQQLLDILRRLEGHSHYMFPLGFDEAAALGKPFEVKSVRIPRLEKSFFALTWKDLLSHHKFHFSSPDAFYVRESDYFSVCDEGNIFVQRYQDAVSLIQFLSSVSDVTQTQANSMSLIFLLKEKLEMPVEYGDADLCELSGLRSFLTEFSVIDQHSEQRKSIIKSVLSDLLKAIPVEQRFKQLLKVFSEFVKRANENFQLYVADFSFERVKEEVEENRLDYTLKLNKVFSEIQNQLLAVPAALLLIGSQFDSKADSAPKNWLVILGVFVFSWFMNMLIKNQTNSLDAIKKEIDELKDQLNLKDKPLIKKLGAAYDGLDTRHVQQLCALKVVDAIVATVLGVCVFIFGKFVGLW